MKMWIRKTMTAVIAVQLAVFSAQAETINVPDDYSTIQAAVDAADVGDIIQVAAGIYSEQVVINKAVSLDGENASSTIIDGGGEEGAVLMISTDNVTLTDFTITGSGTNDQSAGIALLNVTDCSVVNCAAQSNVVGIVSIGGGGHTFSSNTLKGNGNGIALVNMGDVGGDEDVGSVGNTLLCNTITDSLQYGIWVAENCSDNHIEGNTVTDCAGSGIYVWKAADSIVINNTVSGNAEGIQNYASADAVMTGNTVTSNGTGFLIRTGIYGDLQPAATNVLISGNEIVGNTDAGIDASENQGHLVTGTENWWGAADGPSGEGPGSVGDTVSVSVDYSPWLGDEAGSYAVHYVAPGSSIQTAVDAASAGDTIYVGAGTYLEQVEVDKAVTLDGDSSGTTIINGGGAEGAVVTIATNGVTLTDFTVTGSDTNAQSAGIALLNVTDCSVMNCVAQSNVTGIAAIGGGNHTFSSNTLTANGNGIALVNMGIIGGDEEVGSVGNTISQNTVVGSLQHGIWVDKNCSGNRVEGNTVTGSASSGIYIWRAVDSTVINNTVSGNAVGIQNFASANAVMTGNAVTSNGKGFLIRTGTDLLATNVVISGNVIVGNTDAGIDASENKGHVVQGTRNWWGAANGPSGEGPGTTGDAVSVYVDYSPWMGDEESAYAVHYVAPGSSIQTAMDAASAGDTIYMGAGTYCEQIEVTKAVAVVGDDAETTIINGGGEEGAVVTIAANSVTLTGFTVTGSGTNDLSAGIALLNVTNCSVIGCTSESNVTGIAAIGGGSHTISSNSLPANGNAIALVNMGDVGGDEELGSVNNTISQNTITGSLQYGVWVAENCSGNRVDGNTVTDSSGSGIYIWKAADSTVINNTLSGNAEGIQNYSSADAVMTGNSVTSNGTGFLIRTGTELVATNVMISGNVIVGNTVAGIDASENKGYIVQGTENWWGAADGPSGEGPGTTGDSVSVCVDYSPWMGDEEGSYAVYYVTAEDSVQAAVDAASAGDKIIVAEGTYTVTGQLVIDKDLSIIGAGADAVTLLPVYTSSGATYAAENGWISVSEGVTFNLSGITIDGADQSIEMAIVSRGTVVVDGCAIKNIGISNELGWGICILNGTDNIVRNSEFSGIQRIGVQVRGNVVTSTPSATIENCVFTGMGDGDWCQYGVEFGGGGSGSVIGCTISNYTGVLLRNESDSCGILATDYYGNGTVASVSGNTIVSNSAGIMVGYADDDVTVLTASENKFIGNDVAAFSTSNADVTVSANWFESDTPDLDTLLEGPVVCESIYADEDMTQLLFYEVFVDDDFDAMTPNWGASSFAAVQEGIDATAPNGVVNVAAGMYEEFVTVDKVLSLIGAGSGYDEDNDAIDLSDDTVISGQGSLVTISTGGFDATNRLVVKNIQITNGDDSGNGLVLVNGTETIAHVTLENVSAVHNQHGVLMGLGMSTSQNTKFEDVVFLDSVFSDNAGIGINPSGADAIRGFELINCYANNNGEAGFQSYQSAGGITGITIREGSYANNTTDENWNHSGVYIGGSQGTCGLNSNFSEDELLPNTFENFDVSGNNRGLFAWVYADSPMTISAMTGSDIGVGAYGAISLLAYDCTLSSENVVIQDCLFDNVSCYPTLGTIYVESFSPSSNVIEPVISSCSIENSTVGISLYGSSSEIRDAIVTNCSLVGNDVGILVQGAVTNSAIHHNVISDNTTLGLDASTATYSVNATFNYWGAENPDFTAEVSGSVSYDAWYADEALTQTQSMEVYVDDDFDADTPEWGVKAFASVQNGIDGTAPNGVVNIAAGEYTEQLEVSKAVSLIGEGADRTVIKGVAEMPLFFNDGNENYPVVYLRDTEEVTIRDLTVDGDGQGSNDSCYKGIGFSNAGGTIEDVTVIGTSASLQGDAIYASNTNGTDHSIVLRCCSISGFQKNAIDLNGTNAVILVENCDITGAGATAGIAQNGIQLWGASGTVHSNSVSDIWSAGDDGSASGILVIDSSDVVIDENTITNCTVSINATNSTGTAQNLEVTGNNVAATESSCIFGYRNVAIQGNTFAAASVCGMNIENSSEVSVSGNSCTESENGLAVNGSTEVSVSGNSYSGNVIGLTVSGESQIVVDGDTFTDNTDTALLVTSVDADVDASNCIFSGNTAGVVNFAGGLVDATFNYWGAEDGPSGEGAGSGDSVSAGISYSPWWADEAMTLQRYADNWTFDEDLSVVAGENVFVGGAMSVSNGATLTVNDGILHTDSLNLNTGSALVVVDGELQITGENGEPTILAGTFSIFDSWGSVYFDGNTVVSGDTIALVSHLVFADGTQLAVSGGLTLDGCVLESESGGTYSVAVSNAASLTMIRNEVFDCDSFTIATGDALIKDNFFEDGLVVDTAAEGAAVFHNVFADLSDLVDNGSNTVLTADDWGNIAATNATRNNLSLNLAGADANGDLFIQPGAAVEVTMDLDSLAVPVSGVDALMGYNTVYLGDTGSVSVTDADVPWTFDIYEGFGAYDELGSAAGVYGLIDKSIGVDMTAPQDGTTNDATALSIGFTATAEEGVTKVFFRVAADGDVPADTRLTSAPDGMPVYVSPFTANSGYITVDGTAPLSDLFLGIEDQSGTVVDVFDSAAVTEQGTVYIRMGFTDELSGLDISNAVMTIAHQESGSLIDAAFISSQTGGELATTCNWAVVIGPAVENGIYDVTAVLADRSGNTVTNVSTLEVNKTQIDVEAELVDVSTNAFSRDVLVVLTDADGTVIDYRTQTASFVNQTGTVTVTKVPDGVAAVSVDTDWTLRTKADVVYDADGQSAVSVSLLGGDLNNDNLVDMLDFARLRYFWMQATTEADVDGDGAVNSVDYSILRSNWYVSGNEL